ncbi:5-oxoprolinase subunit PxpA [Amycolatopsis ultiminotia]|uniref:5-oxoprolinase subunit A n=1 Tax=Amycolatopsis ultiminotia TaxID=543629 RepID=A0ABP6YFT2_9PSEU
MDLNSDLGEGFGAWKMGDDDAMLDIVTSANIACGFHAGEARVMRRVCDRAAERGVTIGAHVGYRDLAGFGRRALDIAPEDLADEVLYQIGALDGFARAAGSHVRYVKAHGALYNTAAVDQEQAAALVEGVRRHHEQLALLCPPDSEMLHAAMAAGVPAYAEAFADRAYTPEGRLVSRKKPGAVLHDASEVATRALTMATTGDVSDAEGGRLTLRADSLCVHGDTPGAVELAERIRAALTEAGVPLRSFV